MKKYGKLIIAFAWLGLTMVMMITATFAWFSENRTVKADGMDVIAETSKNLVISNSSGNPDLDGNPFVASSSITGVTKLTPVSTSGALSNGALSFFKPTAAIKSGYISYSTGAVDTTAAATDSVSPLFEAATVTEVTPASGTVCEAVKHIFNVKVDGEESAVLYNLHVESISITYNDGTPAKDISDALRVAVVCGSHIYIYALNESTTAGISSTAGATTNYSHTAAATSGDVLAETVGSQTNTTINIYVWYEGQDANCTSKNSIDAEQLSIVVKFTAKDSQN